MGSYHSGFGAGSVPDLSGHEPAAREIIQPLGDNNITLMIVTADARSWIFQSLT